MELLSNRFHESSAARSSCGVQSPRRLWIGVFDEADGPQRVQLDQEVENIFGLTAANRQHAMGGNGADGLAVVVVHLELLLLVGIGIRRLLLLTITPSSNMALRSALRISAFSLMVSAMMWRAPSRASSTSATPKFRVDEGWLQGR